MKIGIITIHCQTNFGSVFQAYALHQFLKDEGFDNFVIDYRPGYIINSGSGFRKRIKTLLFYAELKSERKKYDLFINNYITLTSQSYKSYIELKANPPEADVYISGSDQLWNPDYACGNDDSYKLKFIDKKTKISYATSIGKKEISRDKLSALVSSVSEYYALSVREKSSSELLINEMNRDVRWVCDPVFLLDKSHYEQMCDVNRYGEYVLVYLADNGDLLDKTIEVVKEHYKCKVILACGSIARCFCDEHIKNPGPVEMLTLVYHAKAIITGSFHATSFSHIFNKDFFSILPSRNGERLVSLLEMSGFSNKAIINANDLDKINFKFDFAFSNASIANFKIKSQKWLLGRLNDITNERLN